MKKYFNIWVVLWVIVGVTGAYAIFNEKKSENKDAERVLYAEKCYDINGIRCISFEQMKYIAIEKLTTKEIDDFSQKCGFVMKKDNTNKNDWSSEYGFDEFKYCVLIVDNKKNWLYRFNCHLNTEYVNKLYSDIKKEDNSAYESRNYISCNNIDGLINVSMSWVSDSGTLGVSIMVNK